MLKYDNENCINFVLSYVTYVYALNRQTLCDRYSNSLRHNTTQYCLTRELNNITTKEHIIAFT